MATDKKNPATTLWIGVALCFAILIGAWVLLFRIAANNRVAEVPLEQAKGAVR